jgi:hypothetical protein
MFWAFKFSFVVDVLAFFALETFLGYFLKNWAICFKSYGHPASKFVDAIVCIGECFNI